MSCDIIIVKYGLPDLEAECAASVREHTDSEEYTLTLHDNYEADESLSKVWNDCIRESNEEYICLLNNDTRIEEDGWLSKLLETFDRMENLGAVGPVTNSASGPQGNEVRQKKWLSQGKEHVETKMLVGFCMVFPKKVWEEIGGFDEEYVLYGEDSDFCKELLKREYKLAIRTDVFIFHHGKSSSPIALARGKDIQALMLESRVRYRNKWFFGKPADKEKQALLGKAAIAARDAKSVKRQALYAKRHQEAVVKRRSMTNAERKKPTS